jgi:arylsulfatase
VSETVLAPARALSPGKHILKIEYTAGDVITLSVDGEQAARQTVVASGKYINSFGSDGVSVGKDLNSPVTKRYAGTHPFNGRVTTVVVEQQTTPTP